MRRAHNVRSLAILSAAAGATVSIVSPVLAANLTWTGLTPDPLSATYTVGAGGTTAGFAAGTNLYIWNTSVQNWASGGGPVAYTAGDNITFTDDPAAGQMIRLTNASLTPANMTFTHVTTGAASTKYYFLLGGDFLNGATDVSSSSPFGAANPNANILLDTGFLGHVVFRAQVNTGALNGNTIIRSGILELQEINGIPGNAVTRQQPNVELAGGELRINIISPRSGNTQPGSADNAGILNVTGNALFSLTRPNQPGNVTISRTWNGPVNVSPGVTLSLTRTDPLVTMRINGNMSGSTGTFLLVDSATAQQRFQIESGGGNSGSNATWNTGTGTSILQTNTTTALGALVGASTTFLRAGTASGTFQIGAKNVDSVFDGLMADNDVNVANLLSVTKTGTANLTLTNANTYTGTTTVNGGTLILGGATGAVGGTGTVNINSGGTLKLDNSVSSNNNRISPNQINLGGGGNLEFVGNLAGATAEVAGPLTVVTGSNTVKTTAAGVGTTASISFASFARTGGVVNFDLAGSVNANFATPPTPVNGIIGGFATAGNDWASLNGSNNVVALATYKTDNNPATWVGTDNIDFTSTGSVPVSANTSINSLKMSGAGGNLGVASGQTLVIGTGGVLATANATIGGPGNLTAGSGAAAAELIVHVPGAGNTLTIGSPIVDNTAAGTVGLVKAGPGKLVISGVSTYTGALQLLAGTLAGGAANVFPTTSTLTVDFGSTFDLGGFNQTFGTVSLVNGSIINSGGAAGLTSGIFDVRQGTVTAVMTGAGSLTKTTGNTVTLSAVNTYTGGTSISNGTLVTSVAGALPAGGSVLLSAGGAVLNIGATNQNVATVTLTNGQILGSGVLTGTQYDVAQGTISAVLAGTNVNLTKTTNQTVVLSNANTYTGVTNMSGGGVVTVNTLANGGVASGIGASSNAATNLVLNNGTLNYIGTGASIDRQLTVSGGNSGIASNGTGALVFTSTAAVADQGVLLALGGNNTGDNSFSPLLSAGGGITKANGGLWILANNANTYTGVTTLSGGTLVIGSIANGGSPSAIGASGPEAGNLVLNGGTLRYTGNGSTNRLFTLNAAGGTIDASGTGPLQFNGPGAVAYGGATNRTLTLAGTNTGDNTLALTLADAGGGTLTTVTKAGTGRWILSGDNTNTGGVNVQAGTLVLGHHNANGGGGTLNITGGRAELAAGLAQAVRVTALNVQNAGVLDIKNNDMVQNYTGPGPNPALANEIREDAAAGRLITTSAGTPPNTAVGYADNAVFATPYTSFGGRTVDADTVLIKFTYEGDTNLDGQVDITDLGTLATAWQTNGLWSSGDSDYNGFVDITDLGKLATNWQAGVGNPLGPSFADALASVGLGGVTVPEPGTIGMLGLCVAGVLARRSRRA